MSLNSWLNGLMNKLKWYDISCVKIGTAAFMLMLAKFWPVLLSLDWYWYLVITVVAMAKPLHSMFGK